MEMRTFFLLLYILLLQLGVCDGLRCYGCSSSKSWEDCETVKHSLTCPVIPNAVATCFSVEKRYSSGHAKFAAGCVNSKTCNNSSMCANTSSCTLNCCKTDFCVLSRASKLHSGIFTTTTTLATAAYFIIYFLL